MKKIDSIIVDDHLLFSEGLDGLISDFEEFNIFAVLANGMALIDYFSADNLTTRHCFDGYSNAGNERM